MVIIYLKVTFWKSDRLVVYFIWIQERNLSYQLVSSISINDEVHALFTEHTFLDCTATKAFYSKALSWFNHENDTDITLFNKQIFFFDIPHNYNSDILPITQHADYTFSSLF